MNRNEIDRKIKRNKQIRIWSCVSCICLHIMLIQLIPLLIIALLEIETKLVIIPALIILIFSIIHCISEIILDNLEPFRIMRF